VSVEQVLRRRDRFAAALEAALEGERDGPALQRAARALFKALGGRTDYPVLCSTVAVLSDPAVRVRDLAWAVAGNLAELKAGRVVAPGRWPVRPSWLAVQVVAVRRQTPPPPRRRKVRVRLFAQAGVGCPGAFEIAWTEHAAAYFAGHPRGLGLTTPEARYRHPGHLVGLRFAALIEPGPQGPKFVRLATGPAQRKRNLGVALLRNREHFPCPEKFTHPCAACPRGYDRCPAAVRPKDLVVVASCGRCHKRGWADPAWSLYVCLGCLPRTL
jgi:hypothetical protein